MVLVIEDDVNLRETICDILEASGQVVTSASNGWEGLLIAKKQQVDLVICDVNMPIMDGLETIRRFRKSSKHAFIPFLFLSAFCTMEQLRKGMNLGADDYLTKPLECDELMNTVNRLLKKYSAVKDCYRTELNKRVEAVLKSSVETFQSKNQAYLDRMEQARMVQNAILPNRAQLKEVVNAFGLFHSPKEIVSGDFYWVKKVGGKSYVAVGDCTGHGYPGALMTMVCSNALSISVDVLGMKGPKDILNRANELIIDFMSTKNDLANHGMDIVLCCIDYTEMNVSFSGAKRPFIYIANRLNIDSIPHHKLMINNVNGESIYRIKGGAYSIGDEHCPEGIEEHTIKFRKGDLICLSTDGFCDQMGEAIDKKFMFNRFVNLLQLIRNKSMEEQEQELEKSFLKWKGESEQTDDVTVMMIRL